MPLKKLYLIVIIALCSFNAFSNNNFNKYDESTWTILIIFGIILIIVFTYLFLHAYFERLLRNKEFQKIQEEKESDMADFSSNRKESTISKTSDELLNIFLLKRKGVITEPEYQRMKERLIKSKNRR